MKIAVTALAVTALSVRVAVYVLLITGLMPILITDHVKAIILHQIYDCVKKSDLKYKYYIIQHKDGTYHLDLH